MYFFVCVKIIKGESSLCNSVFFSYALVFAVKCVIFRKFLTCIYEKHPRFQPITQVCLAEHSTQDDSDCTADGVHATC